ncbi:MAG TPA: hypothetical protein VGQ36_03605 [Thermoanaerobaculia bacterium]|jgi:hypothetical protein|nr:hypothetical protein [Thermoanaerobaculia bacterium]
MRRLSEDIRRLGLDLLIAAGVNGILFVVSALVLWPMGKASLAGQLAIGLCLFAILIGLVVWVSAGLQTLFRIEEDPPSKAFVIMNLAVSGALQVGWSAYAALAAGRAALGASLGIAATLYVVGFLSSFLASVVVGAFYHGHLYKMVNALLAIVGYLVFAVCFRP